MGSILYFKENEVLKTDLYLDHVFLELENEPILFTCTNNKGDLFLCHCYEMRRMIGWTISQTTPALLHDLVEKRISVVDAIENSNETRYRYELFSDGLKNANSITFSNISELDLPQKDVFLDYIDFDAASKYVTSLSNRSKFVINLYFDKKEVDIIKNFSSFPLQYDSFINSKSCIEFASSGDMKNTKYNVNNKHFAINWEAIAS